MSRVQSIPMLIDGDCVRMPNVADIASNRYVHLMKALDFFKELAEKHGSTRHHEGDNVFWEARFGEHEIMAVRNWVAWHGQYALVNSMKELFTTVAETKETQPCVKN